MNADRLGRKRLEHVRQQVADRFEVIRLLGQGGMGAVYLATDLKLKRPVALKVMLPQLEFAGGHDRFLEEATRTAGLDHPNIVIVHEVEEFGDLMLFVMRLIDGASLERVLSPLAAMNGAEGRKLPVPIVQHIVRSVAAGLQYAHQHGIIHRDIKPSNVLVTTSGNIIISDFGISKATTAGATSHSSLLIGTPTYMSPEQCMAQPVSGASDQYSLGVMAYQLLSGAPPFGGKPFDVQTAHVRSAPPSLRAVRPDIPIELVQAVERMLSKSPEKRFKSIDDAAAAFSYAFNPLSDVPRATLGRAASAAMEQGPNGEQTPGALTPRVTTIEVTAPTDIPVGASFVVSAVLRDAMGGSVPGLELAFASAAPDILAIDERRGVAIALQPGTTTLFVTANGMRGEAHVTIRGASAVTPPFWKQWLAPPRIWFVGGTALALVAAPTWVVTRGTTQTLPATAIFSSAVVGEVRQDLYDFGRGGFEADLRRLQPNPKLNVRNGRLFLDGDRHPVSSPAWHAHTADFALHVEIRHESGNPAAGTGLVLEAADGSSYFVTLLFADAPTVSVTSADRSGASAPIVAATPVEASAETGAALDLMFMDRRMSVFVNGRPVTRNVAVLSPPTGRVSLFAYPGQQASFRQLSGIPLVPK